VGQFLPASARPYETQRLIAAYGADDDADGPDEDIEFLASLVDEIERTPADPAAAPRVQPAPGVDRSEPNLTRALPRARPRALTANEKMVRAEPDDEAKLNVFRAMRDEPQRVRTSQQLRVRDVELDDLLEDLSTTAAAIRRRKAA